MTDHQDPNTCSNCGGPVAVRRPSTTGKHFCAKQPCQAAKQSFYRQHRSAAEAAKRAKAELASERRALVTDALWTDRVTCEGCGRDDALPGWAHPAPGWTGACSHLGQRGFEVGDEWMKIVWPH